MFNSKCWNLKLLIKDISECQYSIILMTPRKSQSNQFRSEQVYCKVPKVGGKNASLALQSKDSSNE